jgi:hypothetical protein
MHMQWHTNTKTHECTQTHTHTIPSTQSDESKQIGWPTMEKREKTCILTTVSAVCLWWSSACLFVCECIVQVCCVPPTQCECMCPSNVCPSNTVWMYCASVLCPSNADYHTSPICNDFHSTALYDSINYIICYTLYVVDLGMAWPR